MAVLSGQQDTTIPVVQTEGETRVGPLKQNTSGSHYNGLLSVNAFDLTGAYAYIQAVTVPPSNTHAQSMLTLPIDGSNHYRIYVEAGVLNFEKKIATVKTVVGSVTYDATNHQFWRIRHNAGTDQIVFETAPNVGGSPGAWTAQATIAREFAITALKFEIKAGTSAVEANAPGTVGFDHARVARP